MYNQVEPMTTTTPKHSAIGVTTPTSGVVSFEVPTPKPKKDEALIRVEWSTVSFFELWQVDFKLWDEYPRVLGVSIGGEVVIAGEDAGVQVGDKVVSYDISSNITRAYQEYAIRDRYKIGKVSVIWMFDKYEPTRT